jgi:hypothetical protein
VIQTASTDFPQQQAGMSPRESQGKQSWPPHPTLRDARPSTSTLTSCHLRQLA